MKKTLQLIFIIGGILTLLVIGIIVYNFYLTPQWDAIYFSYENRGRDPKWGGTYWSEEECYEQGRKKLPEVRIDDKPVAGLFCGKRCTSDAFMGSIYIDEVQCAEKEPPHLNSDG